MIPIANGGGLNPGRSIIGCDFLHLVRLGIRDANDPIVHASIEVIDRVIKRNLPKVPAGAAIITMAMGRKMTAALLTEPVSVVHGQF
jgi:glucoamylase